MPSALDLSSCEKMSNTFKYQILKDNIMSMWAGSTGSKQPGAFILGHGRGPTSLQIRYCAYFTDIWQSPVILKQQTYLQSHVYGFTQ